MFMPGIDNSKTGEEATAEMERWTKAYEAGPTAFMAFHPEGATPMSPTQLGIQAVLCILIGITAAFIVSFFRNTSFLCKVSLVTSMGFIGFLLSDAAYCNWYRYPLDFTGAKLVDKLVGMALVGIVLATIIRNTKTQESK